MNKEIFIDRDGVINRMVKYAGGFDSPQRAEDVSLVTGIAEVIKWANRNHILVVLISNQPGVAKGKMTKETFDQIENELDKQLLNSGAHLDYKYYCLHHPKSVLEEYKIICDCRKPKPGLLLQATKDLDIDLQSSIFIGDGDVDALAGQAAGCPTIIYVHNENTPEKGLAAQTVHSTYRVHNLNEVSPILKAYFNK